MKPYSKTEQALLSYASATLKAHLDSTGITYRALAAKAGVTAPTVANFLHDDGRGAGFINVYRMYKAAGLRLSEVIKEWER